MSDFDQLVAAIAHGHAAAVGRCRRSASSRRPATRTATPPTPTRSTSSSSSSTRSTRCRRPRTGPAPRSSSPTTTPTAGTTTPTAASQPVARQSPTPSPAPAACGSGHAAGRPAGPLRLRPAPAAAGHLAVGQAQRRRPHPDRPVVDHHVSSRTTGICPASPEAPTPSPAPLTACSTSANPTAKAAATLRPTNRSCLIRNPDASRLAEGTTFGRTTSTTSATGRRWRLPASVRRCWSSGRPRTSCMAPEHSPLIGTGRAEVRERPCRRQQRSSTGSGWCVRHPPFTRCSQGGRMRPLRGDSRPLLTRSAPRGLGAAQRVRSDGRPGGTVDRTLGRVRVARGGGVGARRRRPAASPAGPIPAGGDRLARPSRRRAGRG